VLEATAHDAGVSVEVESLKDGVKATVEVDVVLVSVGRRPFVGDLGLETVNLAPDNRGFIPTQNFATSAPGIWAIGDVTTANQNSARRCLARCLSLRNNRSCACENSAQAATMARPSFRHRTVCRSARRRHRSWPRSKASANDRRKHGPANAASPPMSPRGRSEPRSHAQSPLS